ncbi:MAG: insulinase family protein [Bacteroidetes bacterium]|nr:insulinase family protein [Bacteroidota bacterium]
MNRSIAPDIKTPDHVPLIPSQKITLDNGLPVYVINAGEEDIVKVDFVFEAGKWYEPKNLLADFVNRMMREGVKGKSAKDIADIFEFYGCNLESNVSFNNAGFQIYSLTKHLPKVLPLLMEIFTEASFPDDEFETILNNRRQKHTERLAKNDYVANRNFLSAMWGQEHPYGRVTEYADFENVTTAMLRDYYKQYYNASNCFAIISGKLNEELLKSINDIFGTKAWAGSPAPDHVTHTILPNPEKRLHTEKKDAVQTTIMIGNATINKYHPDFDKLIVMNTLFGGYFGSRLMANIREEKGYTYGIHSGISSYQNGGILEISAEVGKEVSEATIAEVAKEIHIMRTELVDDEELDTVKNYMIGKLMRSVDGPMKYSDVLKGQILYRRDPQYLNQYLKTIENTTAEEIRELALKYLDFDRMYKVTVG